MPKFRPIDAWADVGSHGGIFYMDDGPIAKAYPGLMMIYRTQVTPDLMPVRIIRRKVTA